MTHSHIFIRIFSDCEWRVHCSQINNNYIKKTIKGSNNNNNDTAIHIAQRKIIICAQPHCYTWKSTAWHFTNSPEKRWKKVKCSLSNKWLRQQNILFCASKILQKRMEKNTVFIRLNKAIRAERNPFIYVDEYQQWREYVQLIFVCKSFE